MNIKITIFTPTYNRAHLLPRVFASLCKQTSFDFEWLIVDDGSTDQTEKVVENFQAVENRFNIRYHKQANGGKHRAINKGVKLAHGEFFLILDSDDFLKAETVKCLVPLLNEIQTDKNLGGIAIRRAYHNGQIVGNEFRGAILSDSLNIRYKHKIQGDLVEIFKTDVLKQYLFPEFKQEKFCPEALIWNRISQRYNLKFINLGLYITEYIEGGLTEKIVKIRMHSPQASMLHYAELANYNIPLKEKVKAAINYWRFSLNTKEVNICSKIKKIGIWSLPLLPLGYLMYLNDKRKHA
ncbi:glycosyltransferase family 2 protein [Mesonia sediminis]|uniref:Glycosyltransferase family 2 protein n=1 Tax=Mesonia sediminis TaxID=1703946 RepID=A0ABW5SFD2_9FLAO